jgi:phage tail sheath protein FI
MPQYLTPGVYIEETSFRSKPIEGVATSVAAIVGTAKFGPIRGSAQLVTSYAEYEKIYGSAEPLVLTDDQGQSYSELNHSALAARAFFDNGGRQLYMSRVIAQGNSSDEMGAGASAAVANATEEQLSINARYAGSDGNLTLQVHWADNQSILRSYNVQQLEKDQFALLSIDVPIKKSTFNPEGVHTGFPFKSLRVCVKYTDSDDNKRYVLVGTLGLVKDKDGNSHQVPIADIGDYITQLELDKLVYKLTVLEGVAPVSGPLEDITNARLELTSSVKAFIPNLGDLTRLWGTLDATGRKFKVFKSRTTLSISPTFDLSELLIANAAQSLQVQRDFSIDVLRAGEVIYSVSGISLDPDASNSLANRLKPQPENALAALHQPISASLGTLSESKDVYQALFELFYLNDGQLNPPANTFAPSRCLISLSGGSDGESLSTIDYIGEVDELKGNTGFSALENNEDISIVLTPNASSYSATTHQGIVNAMLSHCLKMRYRLGIVDARKDMSIAQVRTFAANFDDSRLALYYPWILTNDPSAELESIALPPSGFMAGIYSRNDVERGVHKAPANVVIQGALGFNQVINKFQQELLNPNGINCLRFFAGRGNRVWGARTLSSDGEWKYINVRRYFLFLERSIEKGTQWAVFEPNGEALWSNLRMSIESFLFAQWSSGNLMGSSPESAFFVRCDRTTMTQNDIDSGRLVCEIGVAPLRPAEFVVFRIGQKIAQA